MIEAPTEALHQLGGLPVRLARALLVNTLTLRRWDAEDPGQPVIVEIADGAIAITSPGTTNAAWRAREGQRPNPNLDALLRGLEIWTGPMLDLRTIQQELRRAGLPPLVVEEEADKVVLSCRVSALAVEAAQAEARARLDGIARSPAQPPAPAPRPAALPLLPAVGKTSGPRSALASPLHRSAPLQEPSRPSLAGASAPPAPLFARAVLPAPCASPPRSPGPAQHHVGSPTSALLARSPANGRFSGQARAAELLALLGASPDPLTRHQIVHTLAWSRSTTRAVLAALIAEGRVLPEAASPRSPHQRYRAA